MSDYKLVMALAKTPLGKEIKEWTLLRGGKVLAKRVARLAAKDLALGGNVLVHEALAAALGLLELAEKNFPRYVANYPFLAKFTKITFAEAIQRVATAGAKDFKAIRGEVVEFFIREAPNTAALLSTLEERASRVKGWGKPELVRGVRTPDNLEIADWMIVSQHENGDLWVMAIIESKSVSNTVDLAAGERPVGQHLWDYIRMRSEGLVLDWDVQPREFTPKQIKVNPRQAFGPVPPPSALPTELIAVTPREFTEGQLKKLRPQGVGLTRWPWPVDEDELLRLVRQLKRDFGG
jgi:hypothetical protein